MALTQWGGRRRRARDTANIETRYRVLPSLPLGFAPRSTRIAVSAGPRGTVNACAKGAVGSALFKITGAESDVHSGACQLRVLDQRSGNLRIVFHAGSKVMRSTAALAFGFSVLAFSSAFAASHTVTVNTVQIFSTIDPAKISDYTDYMASANLYDGLPNVDRKGNLVPELAEKWDVSPDATSVTFHLRADAKFQDGSPVQRRGRRLLRRASAQDQSGPANLFAGVLKPGSVEAVDAKTVKFTLLENLLAFPRDCAGDSHRQRQTR